MDELHEENEEILSRLEFTQENLNQEILKLRQEKKDANSIIQIKEEMVDSLNEQIVEMSKSLTQLKGQTKNFELQKLMLSNQGDELEHLKQKNQILLE